MSEQPTKTLDDLVKHVGRYPEEAFLFLREGLAYAVEQLHGAETDDHRTLYKYLAEQELDWNDLIARYQQGNVPPEIVEAVKAVGGCDKLNRHVSGRELCWGLREYALKRWGLLARPVLESWSIETTTDFGRIVFGFIDLDMMQKQPDDNIEDFDDVYDFEEAFDETFRAGLHTSDEEEEEEEA